MDRAPLSPLGRYLWLGALIACVSGAGTAPGTSSAALEWPQFRGLERDGVSAESGLLESWPEGGPPEVWRRPLGVGFSGISVAGGRLYTMVAEETAEEMAEEVAEEGAPGEEAAEGGAEGDAAVEGVSEEEETAEASAEGEAAEAAPAAPSGTEYLVCLDPATGAELWRQEMGEVFRNEFGDGPRATPTVVGDTVYALGSHGQLRAFDAETGEPRWEVDLPAAFDAQVPRWGYAHSPLVEGDLVLVEPGGSEGRALAALDRSTGAVRWTLEEGEAGYSSPVALTLDGVRQVVFLRRAGPEVIALDLEGRVLWRHPSLEATIAIPVFAPPDRLLITAGDDAGAMVLDVDLEGGEPEVEEVWRERTMRSYVNGAVFVDGHFYGFDNATLRALSAADGSLAWAHRGFGKGSLIAVDGHLIVLGDRGVLAWVEATPEGYREKGRFQALEGKTWTAPTLADGRLYLRDQDEIVCYDLRPGPAGG